MLGLAGDGKDALEEFFADEGIEAAGGFVENQDLGLVTDGQQEREFGSRPLERWRTRLPQIELEGFQEFFAADLAPEAIEGAGEITPTRIHG